MPNMTKRCNRLSNVWWIADMQTEEQMFALPAVSSGKRKREGSPGSACEVVLSNRFTRIEV